MNDKLQTLLKERTPEPRLNWPLTDELMDLLRERRKELNINFQWDDENIEQFKEVNERIMEACENGWNESVKEAQALEKRIKSGDSFLNDYEIDVRLMVYLEIADDYEEGEREELEGFLAEETYLQSIGHISHVHYDHAMKKENLPLAIDKSTNWNGEFFGDRFHDYYICYFIHRLLDTRVWSYPDILNIVCIWSDVEVLHQKCTELKKRNAK